MQFGGHYLIAARREDVWLALNDTGVLKEAIPGCRRIEWVTPATLVAEIAVDFGVVKPVFTGDLELSDVVPAQSYTLSGGGRGGLLGLARADARVTLADHDQGTELRFSADGQASGRIMKLGHALVGNRAQWVIDGFFERFAKAMGASWHTLEAD